VKIAPEFSGATVHVADASRVVDVVSSLLSDKNRDDFVARTAQEQEELRQRYAGRTRKTLLSWDDARANRLTTDWDDLEIFAPALIGRRVVEPALDELVPFIDWTFFFSAWELKGRFPAILDDPKVGQAARELYDNAQAILERIVKERRLTARGVYGFWPANTMGEDIVLFTDDARQKELMRFHMLRQQEPIADGRPNRSLADFIAPKESMAPDYIGAFAVTTGIGAEELSKEYEAKQDDYNAIIVKALADRLAEAFAEYLHAQARRDWGYEEGPLPSTEELIREKYRGIRPAFGYPACPDHTEKGTLFELLEAPKIGMALTESFAMTPPASVSGLYFSHPQAKYFNVGRIGKDQLEDYARRKGMRADEMSRWLVGSGLD
jgi:5-methyltetrahydrofolate--homocysteine methyltransferase